MHHNPNPLHPPPARELVLLAAIARSGVIGNDGDLPWRLPADLRRFRAVTTGHAVVMGRKTFESIGKALPGRQNIVVSRRLAAAPPGCELARSLDAALARVDRPGPVFCIGGGELFAAAMDRADRLDLTEIDADFPGDTVFPSVEPAVWQETSREQRRDDASGLAFAFVTYVRRPRASRGERQ
jgi:dihydrofolate reductase